MSWVVLVAAIAMLTGLVRFPRLTFVLVPLVVFLPQTVPRLGAWGAMEVLLPLFVLSWATWMLLTRQKLKVDAGVWILALNFGSRLVSMLLTDADIEPARVVVATWASCFFVYVMAMNLCNQWWTPLRALQLATVVVTALVLLDFLVLSPVARGEVRLDDPFSRHEASSIVQGQSVAVFAVALAAVPITLMLSATRWKSRLFWWAVLAGTAVPGFLSVTRAAGVSLVVVAVLALLLIGRRSMVRASLLVFVGSMLLFVGALYWKPEIMTTYERRFEDEMNMMTLGGRLPVWQAQGEAIAEHPFFGIGIVSMGRLESLGNPGHHGYYVDLLFHYGLVLSLPTFIWLGYLFRRSYLAYRRTVRRGKLDLVSIAMLCTVVNLLVTAVANSYLEFSPIYSIYVCHALGIESAAILAARSAGAAGRSRVSSRAEV